MGMESELVETDLIAKRLNFRYKFLMGIFNTILFERGNFSEDMFFFSEIFDVDVPVSSRPLPLLNLFLYCIC